MEHAVWMVCAIISCWTS